MGIRSWGAEFHRNPTNNALKRSGESGGLPIADRIQLIEELWDTLPSDALPPISDEWIVEIENRSTQTAVRFAAAVAGRGC
jgi:putative addiction module component (TIGR02574 family)